MAALLIKIPLISFIIRNTVYSSSSNHINVYLFVQTQHTHLRATCSHLNGTPPFFTAMKIFAIGICRPNTPGGGGGETKADEPVIITQVFDVAEFNFFQRSSVRQFLTAFTRIFVKRTTPGKRLAVEHEGHVVHTWTLTNNLSGCVICDKEYPSRVAFALIRKVLDEFMQAHTEPAWKAMGENALQFEPLQTNIVSYQDPKNVDKLTKIQQELNETTEIMHQTIDKVLERGVKLDDLVDRSADLSNQSRMFYKTAKKHNSCCTIS